MNWNILPGCPLTPCFQKPDIAGISVWNREDELESSGTLCGTEGTIRQTVYTSGNVRLVQEHFQASDGVFDAFRSILENRTDGVLAIRSLTPFAVSCNPDGREYFCEKRLKPEKPYSAIHHGEGIEADNVLVFRSCGILLLIGWLDQHRHLGTLRLSRNPAGAVSYEKQYLLHASGDYLSQELPPGETLVSQWCGLSSGTEFNALLAEHAERAILASGLEFRRKKAPFVISSWHYFGKHISQKTLDDELSAIRERAVPAEVYQIDGGWYRDIGDWVANDAFPGGAKGIAESIRASGLTPGIWIAPFLLSLESESAERHPDWFLRDREGKIVLYQVSRLCGVLDLGIPEVLEWIEGFCRKLAAAGFPYFKADFTRCVFTDMEHAVSRNPRKNILERFRDGVAAVRRGIGDSAFLNLCGGHTGGNMALADSQRTGHDTYGRWQADNPTPAWQRIQQGMFRSWMSPWRHNDPDAAVIRLCSKELDPTSYGQLSLGSFTDAEAELMVLHQFLAGGTVALGEKIRTLQEERLKMMRRVAPSAEIPSRILDPFNTRCPEQYIAFVKPSCGSSHSFAVYSRINLEDTAQPFLFRLTDELLSVRTEEYLLCDASSCSVIGIFRSGDEVRAQDIPPHGCRVLRIVPVPRERKAFPAVSDGHYAGLELIEFQSDHHGFHGRVCSSWPYPLRLIVALPDGDTWTFQELNLPPSSVFSLDEGNGIEIQNLGKETVQ